MKPLLSKEQTASDELKLVSEDEGYTTFAQISQFDFLSAWDKVAEPQTKESTTMTNNMNMSQSMEPQGYRSTHSPQRQEGNFKLHKPQQLSMTNRTGLLLDRNVFEFQRSPPSTNRYSVQYKMARGVQMIKPQSLRLDISTVTRCIHQQQNNSFIIDQPIQSPPRGKTSLQISVSRVQGFQGTIPIHKKYQTKYLQMQTQPDETNPIQSLYYRLRHYATKHQQCSNLRYSPSPQADVKFVDYVTINRQKQSILTRKLKLQGDFFPGNIKETNFLKKLPAINGQQCRRFNAFSGQVNLCPQSNKQQKQIIHTPEKRVHTIN